MATATGKAAEDKSSRPLQLCIFDDRRGEKEGQEQDKILAFYPATTPANEQASAVGLVQAMMAFTSTFGPESPCDTVHAEHSRWVMHSGEPHIWFLLMVESQWHRGPVRDEGLRSVLRQLSTLLTLLKGPLQQLLDEDSSGKTTRDAVGKLVHEFGSRIERQRGPEASLLHNPLASQEAVQLLQLPRPLFLSMQSLINRVLISPVWAGHPVTGALLLHEHWCLWSTLKQADTAALYQLAASAILPAVRAATQSSFGRRLVGAMPNRDKPGEHLEQHSVLDKLAWNLMPSGLLTLAGNSSEPDAESGQHADGRLHVPKVWLKGAQEWCSLLVLRIGEQLLMLLLPEGTSASRAMAEGCLEVAGPLMRSLGNSVAQYLQATRRGHIPSFRYLFTDGVLLAVRASPTSKVATLARSSLALVNSVRADLETQLSSKEGGFAQVAVWGMQDCWVMATCMGRRRLYVVLEQRGKEGLLDACNTAEHFARIHFAGMFE